MPVEMIRGNSRSALRSLVDRMFGLKFHMGVTFVTLWWIDTKTRWNKKEAFLRAAAFPGARSCIKTWLHLGCLGSCFCDKNPTAFIHQSEVRTPDGTRPVCLHIDFCDPVLHRRGLWRDSGAFILHFQSLVCNSQLVPISMHFSWEAPYGMVCENVFVVAKAVEWTQVFAFGNPMSLNMFSCSFKHPSFGNFSNYFRWLLARLRSSQCVDLPRPGRHP